MKLKQRPEDFIVREAYRFDEDPRGPWRVYLMDKQKLSTFEAVQRICTRMRIPPAAVSFCGLKDKQGRTEQLVAIRDEHGLELPELDLGGGYGIAYVPGDEPHDPKAIADSLKEIVARECRAYGLAMPRITVEPGRAIVGPGGVTLYEVGTVKDVEGLRTYVSVDGGMSDNLRTALYGAEYTCVLASRSSRAEPMLSRLVGKHCESGDIVVRDLWLPRDVTAGDVVAVAATGAYCRSMASNYNFVPRPAVVAVRDGKARVLIRRETEEDLLRLDAEV